MEELLLKYYTEPGKIVQNAVQIEAGEWSIDIDLDKFRTESLNHEVVKYVKKLLKQ